MPNQYFFGTQLMVCPITTPMDRTLMLAQTTAWLPEGLWFDFATGQPYTGGRMMKLWRALEAYPVFAPAGGIVPLADDLRADVLPGHLTLRIFAGADGSYELYEDDGISLNGSSVRTAISLDWQHGTLRVHSSGDLSLLPEERTWHVECIGFAPTAVIHQGEGISTTYDASRNALCFTLQTPVAQGWEVQLEHAALAEDTWLSRIYARLSRMQSDNSEKENAWQLIKKQGRSFSCLGRCAPCATRPVWRTAWRKISLPMTAMTLKILNSFLSIDKPHCSKAGMRKGFPAFSFPHHWHPIRLLIPAQFQKC